MWIHPAAVCLAFLLGTMAQTRRPELLPQGATAWAGGAGAWGLLAFAVVAGGVAAVALAKGSGRGRREGLVRPPRHRADWPWGLLVLSMAGLGWSQAQLRAEARWHQQWPMPGAGLPEGVWLQGTVASVGPLAHGQRLLQVAVAQVQTADEPRRTWQPGQPWGLPRADPLATCPRSVGLAVADTPLQPGEVWRWPVSLHAPVAVFNPFGFDLQRWLFEEGIRAQGAQVQGRQARQAGLGDHPEALRLQEASWHSPHGVERWRQSLRQRIEAAPLDERTRGLVLGLTIGDQNAIAPADWDTLRDTGLAHIAAISGVHIAMVGWLAGALAGGGWRRSSRLMHRLPAPWVARWAALGGAWAYALLAGWGVPAQRTVLMMAVVTLLRGQGLRWPSPLVLLSAAVAVAWLDPWSLGQAGFWLSFAAVGLLMLAGDGHPPSVPAAVLAAASSQDGRAFGNRARPSVPPPPAASPPSRGQRMLGWLKAEAQATWRGQWLASVGLAPLSLVFFQQVSVVGWLANLLGIPVFTVLITPLALGGLVWPGVWRALPFILGPLWAALQWLASWSVAVLSLPSVTPVWTWVALLGTAWAMAPLPWRWRGWGAPAVAVMLCPPLWMQAWPVPPEGHFEVHAIDVGQGTAVLLRTHRHVMLYDTGPQTSPDQNAGRRIILGLLRGMGIVRLDLLALSHGDLDHIGGAASILHGMAVGGLQSSLADDHPLRHTPDHRGTVPPHQPCLAGTAWDWDGVHLEWLHPDAQALAGRDARSNNAVSCVLRVSESRGDRHSVLLTGDAEKEQEAWMLANVRERLPSEVLVVPHHGSTTSSTVPFIEAVAPRLALIQAGARNRYGHPSPSVVQRYGRLGVPLKASPRCGDWFWRSADGPALDAGQCWREVARQAWHEEPAPPEGGEEAARPAQSGLTLHSRRSKASASRREP